mgnify:CR=1 FL=1
MISTKVKSRFRLPPKRTWIVFFTPYNLKINLGCFGFVVALWLFQGGARSFAQEGNRQGIQTDTLRQDSVLNGISRQFDSLAVDFRASSKKSPLILIPRKATYYSLALPGLGQIYTRDYWKLPFVYASFLGAGYFIHVNATNFNSFRTAYEGFYDLETAALRPNIQTQEVAVRSFDYLFRQSKIVRRNFALDQVKRGTSVYRRYRDVSYAFLAFAYALTAIEANVAAHLKNFDISDDLSLRIEPSLIATAYQPTPTAGIRLQFTFR